MLSPTQKSRPSKASNHKRRPSFSHVYSSEIAEESPLSDTPLSDFLSPFRPAATQWVAKYTIISFAVIIRLAVGLGTYSGYQQEPLHGDFEAQRHWLEITNHVPVSRWYFFDLEWWGLDYPPLTAYHSWFLGLVGRFIEPSWFALDTSRGLDDPGLKAYMRATVVFSELAVYIPAVLMYMKWTSRRDGLSPIGQCLSAAAILTQPALILVDHGHFQYNSVMLGFALLSLVWLQQEKYISACAAFVASITFKQMALYYAPAVAGFLLSAVISFSISPLHLKIDFKKLVIMGIATVGSFAVSVAPLIIFSGRDSLNVLKQMAIRIFPFSRGLWEDKVANFWCSANTFIKFKLLFTSDQLQRMSLVATLASVIPVMLVLIFVQNKRKKQELLPWAFAASAWGFFLFSFQVHEKSVLLPLMPSTIVIASARRRRSITDTISFTSSSSDTVLSLVFWINNVAMFSLWPLLKRENLQLQFFGTVMLWNWLVGNFNFITSLRSEHKLRTHLLPGYSASSSNSWFTVDSLATLFWRLVLIVTYTAMASYHLVELFVPASPKFPDIYVVANITIASACFALFWLFTLYQLFSGVWSQSDEERIKNR